MVGLERLEGPEDVRKAFLLSSDTVERLKVYADLLVRWQARINLIGPSTVGEIWRRHVADAAQLVPVGSRYGDVWLDLGSGAGIPGLIVAIILGQHPAAHVHLVESNGKKCAFLREAARLTGAPATIHARRIESIDSATVRPAPAIVTARALAPLVRLLDSAAPWIENGAVGLFLKGQDVDEELTEAAKCWRITARKQPSRTDAKGCVLLVEEAHRVDN